MQWWYLSGGSAMGDWGISAPASSVEARFTTHSCPPLSIPCLCINLKNYISKHLKGPSRERVRLSVCHNLFAESSKTTLFGSDVH